MSDQRHFEELRDIRESVGQIAKDTAVLVGKFDSHIENKPIHQLPPCDAHKALSAKLWVIGTGAVAALVGVAYNTIKGQ